MQYNYKEFKKLFEEDTNKALEYFFEHKKDYSGSIFVWTSCIGRNNQKYGSYKTISKEMLKNRQYKVEISDYTLAIFFTDYCHLTYKK